MQNGLLTLPSNSCSITCIAVCKLSHIPNQISLSLSLSLYLSLSAFGADTCSAQQSPSSATVVGGLRGSLVMESAGDGGASAVAPLNQWRHEAWKRFQFYLDRTTPHAAYRWIGTFIFVSLYALRVYYVQGFYIVTYGLGIYILNLLIGFLSPLVDPEVEPSDGPLLPTKGSDEFKPFLRRLPEFKFWYSITKALCVAFVMTFFSMFDVPVFWPILLCYWIVLFVLTMRRQITHMIKYKYIPFSIGKQKYGGKKPSASSSGSRGD